MHNRLLILVLGSFVYLLCLAVYSYSWALNSTDSGGWLAATEQWMVPQPYGAPLYILLGHALNFLSPLSTAANLSVFLSVIPATITILLTYKTTLKLTGDKSIALISGLVLLGSAVFLSQATTTMYRCLATMFLTAAIYSYYSSSSKRPYLTMMLLGLGTAVHVIVGTITLFLLIWEWRNWRIWWKPCIVYGTIVAFSYSLILIFMWSDTPRLLAGGLNIESIQGYWSTTSKAIVGTLSIYELPERLGYDLRIIVMSFGLAMIPVYIALRSLKANRHLLPLVIAPLYITWYMLTCLDVQTWTYLVFASPCLAILAGCGMKKMIETEKFGGPSGTRWIMWGAVALIITNGIFLNANLLTHQRHKAQDYYEELKALPDDSIVVVVPGPYSLGLFYEMTRNPQQNLIPLVYPYIDDPTNYGMSDFRTWLEEEYDVDWDSEGFDTLDIVGEELSKNSDVFLAARDDSELDRCFVLEEVGDRVKRVIALTGEEPRPYMENGDEES